MKKKKEGLSRLLEIAGQKKGCLLYTSMLDNLEKYKIILASNSPRRKELLSGFGIKYEVKTLPGIAETYPDTLKAEDIPLYIACLLYTSHILVEEAFICCCSMNYIKNPSKIPAATAEPITPATLGPIACINK